MIGKKRFSFGKKLYFFITISVLLATVGTTLIAHFINADQIDMFYKNLAFDNAKNFSSLIDVDFYRDFRALVESEEFTAIHAKAEETEDESLIENFYKQHGVWDAFLVNREVLNNYLKNMEQLKYLYIFAIGKSTDLYDMYLMDEVSEGLLATGTYEAREEQFLNTSDTDIIEPTINYGDWGWLCSAYYPVIDTDGTAICMVGCDISMDAVHYERVKFFTLIAISVGIYITIVIFIAMTFSQKHIISPLSNISEAISKFRAFEGADYDSANVIKLAIKTNDEISDIYDSIRTMQISIVNYINEASQLEKEKRLAEAELNVAADIQLSMLPHDFTVFKCLDLFASMHPARVVGGDFYDFFKLDDSHLAVVIADVAGKGVPASLMGTFVKSVIRSQVEINGCDTARTMAVVNNVICKSNSESMFTTVFLGIFDITNGTLVYTNAGHEYPIICKADGAASLIEGDNYPPVGADISAQFGHTAINMQNGDRLVLYTDGIPEAKSPDNKRFGMKFLINLLNEHKNLSSMNLITEIQNEVVTFSGNCDLFDDSTMLVFTYNKQ